MLIVSQGRGQQSRELEDVAAQQLVSRSQCEPVLALEASHQVAGTSTQSEAPLFPSLDSVCPGQALSFPGPATCRDKMQRLIEHYYWQEKCWLFPGFLEYDKEWAHLAP